MAAREAELDADGRRPIGGQEKSQAISIVYEFAILFCPARHLNQANLEIWYREESCAQLQSPLILKHDPVDDLWPYLRMRVSSDEYAEVLQANPGLAGILDDAKLFRSERLAYRAY